MIGMFDFLVFFRRFSGIFMYYLQDYIFSGNLIIPFCIR